jgi:serpin B
MRVFIYTFFTFASYLTLHGEPPSENQILGITSLCTNHTQFAFSLYPHLDSSDENLLFSPYCLSTCLAMAYAGARETTEAQMQEALELQLSPQEIAGASAELNRLLLPASKDNGYVLSIANALWLDQKSYVLTNYRYAIEKHFGGKVTNLPFSQPNLALATINKWVAEKTQGYIQNLLMQSEISPTTRIVLTNAAYFKGSFLQPFDPKRTHNADFYPTEESKKDVAMMDQSASFPYKENELFQAVALPFAGYTQGKGQIACLILLPKSAENYAMMLQMMPETLTETLSHLSTQQVHLQLPKFALTKRMNLNDALMQMGMKNPFTTQANFSGIDGLLNLYMSQVVHETYFALDEKGVIAEAATGAAMPVKSAPSSSGIEMIADHPFLFLLIDLKTTEVLFLGKFADPSDTL